MVHDVGALLSCSLTRLAAMITLTLVMSANVLVAEVIPVHSDGYVQYSGVHGISAVVDSTGIGTLRSGGNNIRHGLFEFELSDLYLPPSAELESAALQFELSSLISNTSNVAEVAFYGYSSDGVLDASDFNTPASSTDNRLVSNVFPARAESPAIGSLVTIPIDNLAPLAEAIDGGSRYFTVRSETINFVQFQVGALEDLSAVPASLVVVTDTLRGDFNRDGVVDILDIEAFKIGEQEYDLTGDSAADQSDLRLLVSNLVGTWFGDATGDGQFESGDLVTVFSRGKFESEASANWRDGDWNRDGRFDSGDFVVAFSDGGFERGLRVAHNAMAASRGLAASVPEPRSSISFALLLLGIAVTRRHRQSVSSREAAEVANPKCDK